MDLNEVETFSMGEAIVDESPSVETDTTDEKPSKKWMGRFESPEELEQHALRISQEKNELKRKIQEMTQVDEEPETVDPEISNAYQVAYTRKYQDAIEDAIEEYGSQEEIPKSRLRKIQAEATDFAQMRGDVTFLSKKLREVETTAKVVQDPDYAAVKRMIDANPRLKKMRNDPAVFELGKEFLRSASLLRGEPNEPLNDKVSTPKEVYPSSTSQARRKVSSNTASNIPDEAKAMAQKMGYNPDILKKYWRD